MTGVADTRTIGSVMIRYFNTSLYIQRPPIPRMESYNYDQPS
jgi:hypothetical protein